MQPLKILNPAEQVAAYLRDQLLRGVWQGKMPGAPALARGLGLDNRTVVAAFRILENEGILSSQGVGRRRKISLPKDHVPQALRIKILVYEEIDRQLFYMVDLQHRLIETGHVASFSGRSLIGMGLDVTRVERHVMETQADAWVIFAGSREILEWFAESRIPAFAIAGRRRGIPIAGYGPDKIPALQKVVRRLVELGHRRIVMISREERRKPIPGFFEREFLGCLESNGIRTGPYHLPDWKDDVEDFHRCIGSLFQHTPPTAILIDDANLFLAAQQHLSHIGIIAPRDVSLVCFDPNPYFAWFRPTVAHVSWDPAPLVRRVLSWADHVAIGREDRESGFTKADVVEGDTIGPPPERKARVSGANFL